MADYVLSYTGEEIEARLGILDDTPISMELLWENASPTSDFVRQTITIDFKDYTHYMVDFSVTGSNSYNNAAVPSQIVPIGRLSLGAYAWGDVNKMGHRRVLSSTSNAIEFGPGYYNGEENAQAVIPYRVYGIKGVQ